MIDYVALISSDFTRFPLQRLREQCVHTLSEWEKIRDEDDFVVFTNSRSTSRFGAHRRSDGLTLGVKSEEPNNTWGAYIDFARLPNGTVKICRDPTGLMPCWRTQIDGVEILFSSLSALAAAVAVKLEIDWDYIRYHLCAPHNPGQRTGLKSVTEVLPGWMVTISRQAVEEERWWDPRACSRAPYLELREARDALRSAASEAVGTWGRRYKRIALTLSGGLDSAIVLGLLRRYAPSTEIVGVNYLVSHTEGDESAYAEAAARHNEVTLHLEPILPDGMQFNLEEGCGRLRPSNYVLPLGYRQARERIATNFGVEAIFSGTGGDHLFHDTVSPLMIADAISHRRPISEIFSHAHQAALLSNETIWTVLRDGLKLWLQNDVPLKDLVVIHNYFTTYQDESNISMSLRHPDLVTFESNLALGKRRQIIGLHHLQGHYWNYGANFAADEVHPLFSQPLVEAILRIPTYWFSNGGIRRGLAREAFSDLVPTKILNRRGKSSNTSQWIQILIRNLPFLRDLMLDGQLVKRGYIRQDRLDENLRPLRLAGKFDLAGLVACIDTEIWIRQISAKNLAQHEKLSAEPITVASGEH